MSRLSPGRVLAVLLKELVQMRRDRLTFAMMFGLPLLQLVLFGFAINNDPKHLPLAVLAADQSPYGRSFVAALQSSDYFRLVHEAESEAEIDRLLAEGQVQMALTIPADLGRRLLRGERPVLLVEADATDPAATSNALASLDVLARRAFDHDLQGSAADLAAGPGPVELRIHRRYNPDAIASYHVVPGLIGVILTMTMVMMTALAVTRERERGTMESLLALPTRPLEVMLGKILPYIGVGYVQVVLILLAARLVFDVPVEGSLGLLSLVLVLFIAANLAMGFTFSTIARNQLQAMQMSFFFFLPSILLSGFMFPFRGMPAWAQWIGEILPLTHFLRIVRGIMLKGNGWSEIQAELLAILLFLLFAGTVAMLRYRQTLD